MADGYAAVPLEFGGSAARAISAAKAREAPAVVQLAPVELHPNASTTGMLADDVDRLGLAMAQIGQNIHRDPLDRGATAPAPAQSANATPSPITIDTRPAPAPPPLPPGFGPGAGGIYPEDYGSTLATGQLQGKIKPAQYAAEKARYDQWSASPRGMQTQQVRDAQRQSAIEGEFAGQNIETQRSALQQSQEARYNADHAAEIAEQQRERQRQTERAELERRSQQLDQMNADIANGKIDPDRYMKNMNGGAALLSLISVTLGGFANGFSGGKVANQGIELIQNAINRDVAAQQSDMQNKRASYDNQRGLFQLARERFGDNEMAANYTRSKLFEQAERAVQGIASEAKDKTYATALDKMGADLKFQREQSELALKLGMAQAAQAAAAQAGPKGFKTLGDKEMERLVPSLNALAPDKETRVKVTEAMAAAKTVRETLAAMAELKRTGSTRDWTGTDRARYDALRSNAVPAVNVLLGQGAVSAGDAENILGGIPEASFLTFSTDRDAVALETTAALVDKKARDFVNSQALVPVDYSMAAPKAGGGYGPQYRINPDAKAPAPLQTAPTAAHSDPKPAAESPASMVAAWQRREAVQAARRREAR